MMKNTNNNFMLQAVCEAWKYQFLTYPNPAVGSCIVKDNNIIVLSVHTKTGTPHAEVNGIKQAFLTLRHDEQLESLQTSHEIHNYIINNHNGIFEDCEMYVTLEPCNHIGRTPACANLLKECNFKKVYIGSYDPNNQAAGGIKTLQDAQIEVEVGVEKEACDNLLYPFKKWIEGNFKFFKLAMREDGSIDGGYITSKDSLTLVHEIRNVIDLLIIGGNTVRVDRPTLDARLTKDNNPSDVLIYSKQATFDTFIPLFHVKNREVFIDNDLSKYNQKLSMIEGGYNLLEILKEEIDMLMVFISHKEKKSNIFNPESLGFKKIYSYFINEFDEILFLK
jgi:diaminohydroxyphosphoribosylaminopyrimidine deaminase/5-amino-6-(5-phosphoribosylamino)uracil reductase